MSSKMIPPPPPVAKVHTFRPTDRTRTQAVPAARKVIPDTRFKSGVITRSHTERDENLRTQDFARMMRQDRYGR